MISFSPEIPKEIKLPENISEIGNWAFEKCRALEHVKLPKYLKVISKGLFHDCGSLKDIEIPIHIKTIGEEAFEFCCNLESVTFSEGLRKLEKIDNYAFAWCYSLESIKIPAGIKFIGKHAFEDYKKISFEKPCAWDLKEGKNSIINKPFVVIEKVEKSELDNFKNYYWYRHEA